MMITETIIARKRVLYENKSYLLLYRLIQTEEERCGIEIACASKEEVERETVFLDLNREQVIRLIGKLSDHLVFPIALRETLENYL